MPKVTLAAAALLVAAALLTALPLASVSAAPLTGAEIQAQSAGGEFRGYGATRRGPLEDIIWRLAPDGSVVSISQVRRRSIQTSEFVEYRDAGAWRVEGNRLCVQFQSVHSDLSGCYGVDAIGGSHVRLVGPIQLEGTLGR